MSKEKIVYGSIKRKIVSSDLIQERANRDFDDENGEVLFKTLCVGGPFEHRQEFLKVLDSDPILQNSHKFYEMTSEELQLT